MRRLKTLLTALILLAATNTWSLEGMGPWPPIWPLGNLGFQAPPGHPPPAHLEAVPPQSGAFTASRGGAPAVAAPTGLSATVVPPSASPPTVVAELITLLSGAILLGPFGWSTLKRLR